MSYNYGAATYRSSNPLRRFAHNARFARSAELVMRHSGRQDVVLDYGAGDGHFLDVLAQRGFTKALGYDPLPMIRRHDVLNTLDGIGRVSCITCLETLEHVTDAQISEFFARAKAMLKPGGTVIISVPVVIGPAVLVKTLPEVLRGENRAQGYTMRNLMRCLIGRPPKERNPLGNGMYLHVGFDHRVLRMKIRAAFASVSELNSPFPALPGWLNSQVFFICRI